MSAGRHFTSLRFAVTTIPHRQQRYPTVGDWIADRQGHLRDIRVSFMDNDDYHFLVALHEMIEGYLCGKRDIPQHVVDRFDRDFEAKRREGDDREPGHEPDAPYHREHVFAERIERLVAEELGVDWAAYEQAVGALA